MSHDEIRSWLSLPPGAWPPDHYTLLGLAPGENDPVRIEQQVHDRLVRLRSHQLNHPDQATEAMNLLARAFSCLMDPQAKRTYDAALLGKGPVQTAAEEAPTWTPADPLAWLFGPQVEPAMQALDRPSVRDWASAPPPPRAPRVSPESEILPVADVDVNGVVSTAASSEVAPTPPAPPAEPVDPLMEAASSPPARRGLGTKRALYYRIARTRKLLRAWENAGRYVGQPYRRLTRSTEANELSRQLNAIHRHLRHFPPLLGEAGQPGFYVVALARQSKPLMVPTFRMLLPMQREVLARDWRDGLKLIQAHGRFLRGEVRALRRATRWARVGRAVRALLHEHRFELGLLIALLAAAFALLVYYRFFHLDF
jgi:hypothetical protein